MNEYYKLRYNLSKFFTNIDDDKYYNYLRIIIPILYIIPILLFALLVILAYKIINITIIIYIFLFIVLLIITYKLINSLKTIQKDPVIVNYINYYKIANIIYKENYNSVYIKKLLKPKLLKNINNIENLYSENAINHLNNSFDILQYDEINKDTEKYISKIYIDNFKKFKFLNKSMQFIIDDRNNNCYIIDLQLLNDRFPNEKEQLLKYFNNKYNTNFKSLYNPLLFTPNYKRKFDIMVKNYKDNIYNYFAIIGFFILILVQGILLTLNATTTYIYSGIIITLILLMYIYNNI